METRYKIIRSTRRTLSLSVSREGEIIVRVPYGVSKEYIAAFVEKHREWLKNRLAAQAQKPKLDLSDGAVLTLFGSQYVVASGRVRISGGKIFLPQEGREQALVRLLKKFSLEVMSVLTERIALHCGFRYARVRISSARGRWGSCNKDGVIAYTFRVAFLPPHLCEYVVVHELSHTVHFNHSSAFWQTVERTIPDWKIRRKALNSCGIMEIL